ncbi:MAG: Jag N-terminal domain-containing protein [Candidatus Cloacimonadaceae bacterium]|jgi:spoIIIJ-associated protein|nr:Jag N-terminal domain-containing protein [Candidatus Cloacimonadota bacterium]MCB5254280.1 Jag N-terminal domain-containing protein [Candidatus Cloacimonadota bacterium]MCK9178995.1 Jag N-terminal domain-containing protein [Candidatus Cloacimonadota bacterium]MCK9243309.1 Jag N-terminal domain-containing protein [Candidatus Cloacimonadota bacterium]MDY0128234.1 Jag N-terminal domain-containing protein [Candidatus Cloacimonadaceae bacterium]
MNTIDRSGDSVEEIIRKFRSEHNISDHELRYEILKKPSKGFFGLFANKIALVRFQLPESHDRVRLFTETLLDKMSVSFGKVICKTEGKTLFLTIEGVVETGFVIGKNGSMLETIQYLINRVFENEHSIERIYVDADGYRARREAQFLSRYISDIKKIKVHGKSLTLEPMNPGERRIIHRHVERDKGLRTLTVGEGENKRIVIFSSKQKESEVRQQNPQAASKDGKSHKPRKPRKATPNKAVPRNKQDQKKPDASTAPKADRKPRPPRRPRSKPRPNQPKE